MKSISRERVLRDAATHPWGIPQGTTAPALIDIAGLGTTRSGSTLSVYPSPEHSGHIPTGLLKLKSWGDISGRLIPQWIQALCSLMVSSSPESASITEIIPLPSLAAVSMESFSLLSSPGPVTSLSTTTDRVFLFFGSRVFRFSISTTSPLSRALTKPFSLSSASRS